MDEPKKEIIEKLKAEHQDRSLLHVEIDHEEETYHFLMTGPNAVEYRKFVNEILEAKDKPKEADQAEGIRDASAKAAMAQIRWPERETIRELFNRFPAMPSSFREKLHEAAGATVEVRAKKL